MELTPADRVYLDRAYELALRGTGSTSPNPPVGAVVVTGNRIAGEGYHHRAGEPHAEVLALEAAGESARGATLYVSLEPCNHHGRTPPCSQAVARAGIARVVAGVADPDPRTAGAGVAFLRESGIDVQVADDARARDLIAPFARAIQGGRPFVTLKMAMSMDGYVSEAPGVQTRLTGADAAGFVRELRIAHDAVAVGAGTVRIDDPQLTVRPPHLRAVPYTRVVFSQSGELNPNSRVFEAVPGYAPALVVPGCGEQLGLDGTLKDLYARGIRSLLCEGGPAIAGALLRQKLVDRVVWIIAPRFLHRDGAVSVVTGAALGDLPGLRVNAVELLGTDVMISGMFDRV